MQRAIREISNLEIIEGEVDDLTVRDDRVAGVRLGDGREFAAGAVVLTTGTFLRGLIHIGETKIPAGRAGEAPALGLSGDPGAAWVRAETAQDWDAAAARWAHHRLEKSPDAARR